MKLPCKVAKGPIAAGRPWPKAVRCRWTTQTSAGGRCGVEPVRASRRGANSRSKSHRERRLCRVGSALEGGRGRARNACPTGGYMCWDKPTGEEKRGTPTRGERRTRSRVVLGRVEAGPSRRLCPVRRGTCYPGRRCAPRAVSSQQRAVRLHPVGGLTEVMRGGRPALTAAVRVVDSVLG